MTAARPPIGVPETSDSHRESTPPEVRDLVARLRSAADRMVAFSVTKTLLRDAATTIEHLEGRLTAQGH